MLRDLFLNIEYKKATLLEHFKYENECLGQVITVDPNENKHMYFVKEISTTKSITRIQLYEIFSGKNREVKIWTSQINKSPICKSDILNIHTIEKKNKKEPTGEINPNTGKKIYADVPDKFEYWLKSYTIKREDDDL